MPRSQSGRWSCVWHAKAGVEGHIGAKHILKWWLGWYELFEGSHVMFRDPASDVTSSYVVTCDLRSGPGRRDAASSRGSMTDSCPRITVITDRSGTSCHHMVSTLWRLRR